jgi:dihydrofolate reductase
MDIKISAMVAQSSNRVIGHKGDIPWRGKLKGEQKLFKEFTMGKIVCMGRKTWESIPDKYRPLPGRLNMVLTSNPKPNDKCIEIDSVVKTIQLAVRTSYDEMVFIGGQRVYEESYQYWDTLYLTTLDMVFEGDTYFPELVESDWALNSEHVYEKEEGRICSFKLEVLDRM